MMIRTDIRGLRIANFSTSLETDYSSDRIGRIVQGLVERHDSGIVQMVILRRSELSGHQACRATLMPEDRDI
jgi:hypothetical protein